MEYYRENNKLIAEFMELPTEVFKSGKVNYYFREFNSGTWYEEHELSYHVSWDWLMPVVERIEFESEPEVRFVIMQEDCIVSKKDDDGFWKQFIEFNESSKREATYKAVVEFIKQYNNK